MSGATEHLLSSWNYKPCQRIKLWHPCSLVFLQAWPSKLHTINWFLPERTSLMLNDIISRLSIPCLDATFLSFKGKVYQEVKGNAMGSPVSVAVANLVMEDIEVSLIHLRTPCFWRCNVDDTCTALHPDLVQVFHAHLNSNLCRLQWRRS